MSLGGDGNGENSSEAKGNADTVNPWAGFEISSAVVQVWLFPKMVLDKLMSGTQLEYPFGGSHTHTHTKKIRFKWGHKQGRERKKKRIKQ